MPVHHIYVRYAGGQAAHMKKDITKNNFQMSAPSEAHKIVEIYVHSEEDGLIDGAPEWVQDLADKEVS